MTRGSQSSVRGKGHQRLQQPPSAPIDPTPIRRALPAGERHSPRNREHPEEIMVNPPRSPRTPSALRQVINVFDEPATDVTYNEDVIGCAKLP